MIKVNLLPVKQGKKPSKKPTAAARKIELPIAWIVAGVAFVALNALGAYFFHSTLQKRVDSLQRQIEEVNQTILQLNIDIRKVEEARKKKDELQQKINIIENLKQGQTGPVAVLDQVAASIPQPSRLWLTDMSQAGAKLNMTGVASGDEEIAKFMRELEKSAMFHSVELSSVTQETRTGYQKPLKTFVMSANIRFEGTAKQ
jgi:type IV pilus assembly protein PilN